MAATPTSTAMQLPLIPTPRPARFRRRLSFMLIKNPTAIHPFKISAGFGDQLRAHRQPGLFININEGLRRNLAGLGVGISGSCIAVLVGVAAINFFVTHALD